MHCPHPPIYSSSLASCQNQNQAVKKNIGAIRLDHTNSSGQVSTIAGTPVLGWRRRNRNENPSYPLKTGFGTPHFTP